MNFLSLENIANSRKIKQFNQVKIYNIEDLVKFFPKRYMDFRKDYLVSEAINSKGEIAILGKIVSKLILPGTKHLIVNCVDKMGYKFQAMFFNQAGVIPQNDFQKDSIYIFCGNFSYKYPYPPTINPIYYSMDLNKYKRIIPVYQKIKGMSEEYLKNSIKSALKGYSKTEYLTEYVKNAYGLISTNEAINIMHCPNSNKEYKVAQKRIVFDTLFDMARFFSMKDDEDRFVKINDFSGVADIKEKIPFTLTEDQEKTINECIEIMKNQRLRALIQGDVGSGKTIVAISLMSLAIKNDFQSVLVAPTEVLARQHYEDLKKYFDEDDIAYLSGSQKKKERNKNIKKIENGCHIIVGTHSLFSNEIPYKQIGLLVIDEEHRFGVDQRDKLSNDAHIITMSATPIPRSVAISVYGNRVKVFDIKTKPQGRKPIKTMIIPSGSDLYSFLEREIQEGSQIYVVCPLIEKSTNEKMKNIKSVEEEYIDLQKALPNRKIALINGNMKQSEIDEKINEFKDHKFDVLVSTTIIEVGVNVPNATTILIKNSERFGLAQLHQLRGRVGRGDKQGYCILSPNGDDEKSKLLCEISNGFELALKDLENRGAGEFLGTKQSGVNEALVLSLTYPNLYKSILNMFDKLNIEDILR